MYQSACTILHARVQLGRFCFLFVFNLFSDVNECKVRNPCKNGATCVNSVGSYSCQCPENYKGKHCDEGKISIIILSLFFVLLLKAAFWSYFSFHFIDVDECISKKPCKNGAKCENTRGGYKCTCVGKWFTGKHCDQGRVIETFTDRMNGDQMCAMSPLPQKSCKLICSGSFIKMTDNRDPSVFD